MPRGINRPSVDQLGSIWPVKAGEQVRASPLRPFTSVGCSRYFTARSKRLGKSVENAPELFDVPQTLASMGVRSGLRMWCENMCRTAPVPSPLYDANRLLNSNT